MARKGAPRTVVVLFVAGLLGISFAYLWLYDMRIFVLKVYSKHFHTLCFVSCAG